MDKDWTLQSLARRAMCRGRGRSQILILWADFLGNGVPVEVEKGGWGSVGRRGRRASVW